jgi:monofunctional glycosyltransferase
MPQLMKTVLRWVMLIALSGLCLQLYFVLRIACMAVWAPESTSFQRSQAWRINAERGRLPWRHEWVAYDEISKHLKRAVIASEDDAFVEHPGVVWDAMQKAWKKNSKAIAQSTNKPPKLMGGSTITQQLAKNLFLSGERTLWRKGQEFALTWTLEALLDKRRILELYLNSVEWGEGVFGAEAAAQHYYRKSASALSAAESARLAVMLPRPRYFEKLPNSGYLTGRAQTIQSRMGQVDVP